MGPSPSEKSIRSGRYLIRNRKKSLSEMLYMITHERYIFEMKPRPNTSFFDRDKKRASPEGKGKGTI